MVVLGVDPGSACTGFGVLRIEGGRARYERSGTIRAPRALPFSERLRRIHDGVAEIIAAAEVDAVAVEDVYQGINPRTASRIGHVRGVILLAAAEAGLPAYEYPPNEVKSAVVGNGLATKDQVRFMVERILSVGRPIGSSDESDALAVAICHGHRAGSGAPR
ncbi:MAG: crossover junction endodeoxyribonuclease RuvC [Candidatus Eisenbacteria bacterium]